MSHRMIVGVVACLLLVGMYGSSAIANDSSEDNEWYEAELSRNLLSLEQQDVRVGEYLEGEADTIYIFVVQEVQSVISCYEQLGDENNANRWRPLLAWIYENDNYDGYNWSDADKAYNEYRKAGWNIAASRVAKKYADWLWENYQHSGAIDIDMYDDMLGKWLGIEPWVITSDMLIEWYAKAGYDQSQLDGIRNSAIEIARQRDYQDGKEIRNERYQLNDL